MTIDTLEKNQLEQTGINVSAKLGSLHESFQSSFAAESGAFESFDTTVTDESIRQSFGIGNVNITPEIRAAAVNSVRDMYHGKYKKTLYSIHEKYMKSKSKSNPTYSETILNQQAGWAAEVISTEKENFNSRVKHSREITYRADDLPDELRKQLPEIQKTNDQYVDKVRVKPDGSFEKVQTKFVGKDAKQCLEKLKSKKYDKYFEGDAVDKVEIPKDYYDDVKKLISEQREKYKKQFDNQVNKNSQTADKLQKSMDRLDAIDKKLEQSCVTKEEAKNAVKHPKEYAAKQLNDAALNQAATAAVLTAAVSGVQNYQKYKTGEYTGKEAVVNTLKDTAVSGGAAYATEVATQLLGKSVPAAEIIAFGVTSIEDVKDYKDGKITEAELAYELGENAADVIGGAVGGAIGASIAGPVGAMAGSAIGAAVAGEAYQVTVEFTKNTAEDVKDFIDGEIDEKELADRIGDNVETAVTEVKESIDETAATIVEVGVVVKEAAVYVANDVGGKVEELSNVVVEKLDTVADMAAEVTDAVADKAVELKDAAAEKLDAAADKASELKDAAFAKVTGLFNSN